jgi:hypothetical protein
MMDQAQGRLQEKTVKSFYSKGAITIDVFFYMQSIFTVTLLTFLFLFSAPRLFSRTHSEVATTFWYFKSQLNRPFLYMLLAFCAIPHKCE